MSSYSNLNDFVANVQACKDRKFDKILDGIKASGTERMLLKHITQLDQVLEILDMHKHTLGWLAVLATKFSVPTIPDFEALFSKACNFVAACDEEQIRLAPDMFASLCHRMTDALVDRKKPMRGIVVLKRAISKMQSDASQLTMVHPDLCRLCLLAKCYKPALPLLALDVMDICVEKCYMISKNSMRQLPRSIRLGTPLANDKGTFG